MLCLTSTDVDATGKSYYGSTGLFLMHADGQFDCAIAPAKEGTVQDVQWGPAGSKGNKFVVIAGSMPAASTMYNVKVPREGGGGGGLATAVAQEC